MTQAGPGTIAPGMLRAGPAAFSSATFSQRSLPGGIEARLKHDGLRCNAEVAPPCRVLVGAISMLPNGPPAAMKIHAMPFHDTLTFRQCGTPRKKPMKPIWRT